MTFLPMLGLLVWGAIGVFEDLDEWVIECVLYDLELG